MARQERATVASLEKERATIREEEFRLAVRKKKLAEREAAERANAISKSVLGKLDEARLTALLARIKEIGIDKVERRLSV